MRTSQPRDRIKAEDIAQPLRDALIDVTAEAEACAAFVLVSAHLAVLHPAYGCSKVVQQAHRDVTARHRLLAVANLDAKQQLRAHPEPVSEQQQSTNDDRDEQVSRRTLWSRFRCGL